MQISFGDFFERLTSCLLFLQAFTDIGSSTNVFLKFTALTQQLMFLFAQRKS